MPSVKVASLAGAGVEVVNRVESDSSRPSLHPEADGVEIRYIIVAKADDPVPADPEDYPKVVVSRKAKTLIKAGVANVGSRMIGFCRWINSSENAKSSGWSQRFSVLITD